MKIAQDDRAVERGCSNCCGLPLSASERASELLGVHSKVRRCNFWGLLHCDDRRSPWRASRDVPQHDRGRSDTIMISMNFNSCASLVTFFIIRVLFCSFFFDHETFYTRVTCVWFLLAYVSLHNLTEHENLQNSDCPFRSLFEDFRPCSRYNSVDYGTWHV